MRSRSRSQQKQTLTRFSQTLKGYLAVSPRIFRLILPLKARTVLAFIYFWSAATLALPNAATAGKSPEESALLKQRTAYQVAKKAIKNKQLSVAEKQLPALKGYPLKPYIEYQLISARMSPVPYAQIDQFIADYPNSLLTDKLVGSLLFVLAEQEKWAEFNRYYTPGFSSPAMQCRHLLARHNTGDTQALDDALALWTIGKSQPDTCDPLFSLLEKKQKITAQHRWQRFDSAIKLGELTFARYLQQRMDKKSQQLATLYLQTVANPKLITQHNKYADKAVEMQNIIAYAITKLAQKDPALAWKHWESYEAQRLFRAEIATPTKKEVVKYLVRKGYMDEANQLLSYSHSLREASVIEELARENLEQLNWQAVLNNIEMLPEEDKNAERWRYWHARSQQELGHNDETIQAIYQSLATKRSWYGFLAADQLKTQYALQDASTPANPDIKASLSKTGAIGRARELWNIGEENQARAEWYHGLKHYSTEQIVAAGELARDWGWYNFGIMTMVSGNLWDHLSLRFPLAYEDAIARAAANTQLDKALIFAIARQESAFLEDAQSHAGARGLMQLMPATAKQQAKAAGVKHNSVNDLFKPEHNILLGSGYLEHLVSQFNGNRVLATAAYNAGPGRVKQWLGTPTIEKPADVWVETIPFKETRQYVQNVLTYSVIYNYRMASNGEIGGNLLRENELNIKP